MILDRRSGIGPHHLSIGKTRKFDGDGKPVYSVGDGIAGMALPTTFGGGAFCVDGQSLIYVHKNRRECYLVRNGVERKLCETASTFAAPWVTEGPDGRAWWSVLSRDGNYRIGLGENARVLTGWYHSAIQVMPLSSDRAVAIGFRGEFPTATTLVFQEIDARLRNVGEEIDIECNVNDRTTFHFQAVSDFSRELAHVVFLGAGLCVQHAVYFGDSVHWTDGPAIDGPCFAPQITLDSNGVETILAADYRGNIRVGNDKVLRGVRGPNISPLFALTGYGTGGMISGAKTVNGKVPLLVSRIIAEYSGVAELSAHYFDGDDLAPYEPPTSEDMGDPIAYLAQNPAAILRTYRRMV